MTTARTPVYLGRDSGNLRLEPDRTSVKKMKCVLIKTADTADDTDTVAVTLANYGLSNVKWIESMTHTVLNSTLVSEEPNTTVSAGVLTITVGGSTDNKERGFLIFGEEA